jgi:hypothetical protein
LCVHEIFLRSLSFGQLEVYRQNAPPVQIGVADAITEFGPGAIRKSRARPEADGAIVSLVEDCKEIGSVTHLSVTIPNFLFGNDSAVAYKELSFRVVTKYFPGIAQFLKETGHVSIPSWLQIAILVAACILYCGFTRKTVVLSNDHSLATVVDGLIDGCTSAEKKLKFPP